MSGSFAARGSDGGARLQSPATTPRASVDDPKFLFSAEARERIRQLPSTTPVPLFHPRNSSLVSPSASITSSIYSSSTLPPDSSSLPLHLPRPQPRSPHDPAAWDSSSHTRHPHNPLPLHSFPPHHQAPILYHLQPTASYTQPSSPYDPAQSYSPSTPSSARPLSTSRSAPFFASLAKHAPLPMLPLHPSPHSSSSSSPYPRPLHSVAVYAEFDKAWMRTPLPKSVADHPMALAHAEATRRREEWERAEEQRKQQEEWERSHHSSHPPPDGVNSCQSAKKGGVAKLGKRPALPSHRGPSAVFSSPVTGEGGFRTPLPRAKHRQAGSQASTQKRRIAPVRVDEREEQKQEEKEEETQKQPSSPTPPLLPRLNPTLMRADDAELSPHEDEHSLAPAGDETEGEDDSGEVIELSEDEDIDEGDTDDDPAVVDEAPPRLSPVQKRLSNRVYTSPSTVPAPTLPSAPLPISSPPSSTPLKPDLTLTGWFLHLKPSTCAPSASHILLKGVTPSHEPWVTGYVLERLSSFTLLTKSRRYHLVGPIDQAAMRAEGWTNADLHTFRTGFPADWRQRVQREVERRQAAAFEYEEVEEPVEENWGKGPEKKARTPLLAVSSRPHRSPAPPKVWKSSEWSEEEVLRLVKAHLQQEGQSGRDLWRLVAAVVGNERTGEECRRKWEEIKREQQTTIALTERAHATPHRREEEKVEKKEEKKAESPRRSREEPRIKALPTAARLFSTSAPSKPKKTSIKTTPSRKEEQKALTAREVKEAKTAVRSSTEAKPRATPKAPKTPRAKPPSSGSRSARSSAKTPSRVVDAGWAASTVMNPHELAHFVSRRSGRAVIAPLKWWETERGVNGVVVKGAHADAEAYQQALSAKEKRERETREDGGRWSKDERAELFAAYSDVDPTERNFWDEVAARVPGRGAEECQRQFHAMYPTPKRRGKRKQEDTRGDERKEEMEAEERDGEQRRRRKRVTTRKRELREALAQRDAEHAGDDLFDSTPFKDNKAVAAPSDGGQRKRVVTRMEDDKQEDEGDSDEAVLVGDVGLADAVVQRLVKERRKTKTNANRARAEEQRRRDEEEAKRKQGDRFAETAVDVKIKLRALEEERQQLEQERLDEMEDEEEEEEGDEEGDGD